MRMPALSTNCNKQALFILNKYSMKLMLIYLKGKLLGFHKFCLMPQVMVLPWARDISRFLQVAPICTCSCWQCWMLSHNNVRDNTTMLRTKKVVARLMVANCSNVVTCREEMLSLIHTKSNEGQIWWILQIYHTHITNARDKFLDNVAMSRGPTVKLWRVVAQQNCFLVPSPDLYLSRGRSSSRTAASGAGWVQRDQHGPLHPQAEGRADNADIWNHCSPF